MALLGHETYKVGCAGALTDYHSASFVKIKGQCCVFLAQKTKASVSVE